MIRQGSEKGGGGLSLGVDPPYLCSDRRDNPHLQKLENNHIHSSCHGDMQRFPSTIRRDGGRMRRCWLTVRVAKSCAVRKSAQIMRKSAVDSDCIVIEEDE